MKRDFLELGPCPCDEEPAQLGEPDFDAKNKAECRHFILAIKRVCGEPPEGAYLTVKTNHHEWGEYREVAIYFDPNSEVESAYAFMVEEKAPATWAEARMEAPESVVERSR